MTDYIKKIQMAYKMMKSRCYNKNRPTYKYYGGRGIKVCKRWLGKKGLANFIKDIGFPPSKKYSLDRVNVNDDYKPSNCKWATKSEQNRNRRKYSRGIYFSKKAKKWNAYIHLGSFSTKSETLKIYNKIFPIVKHLLDWK